MELTYNSKPRIPHSSRVRVAICGELPTAKEHLLQCGVVHIDQYLDATEIPDESVYHLILVYAPHGEGLLNTVYTRSLSTDAGSATVPIRLLNEPACHSALIELKSMIRRISSSLSDYEVSPVVS